MFVTFFNFILGKMQTYKIREEGEKKVVNLIEAINKYVMHLV